MMNLRQLHQVCRLAVAVFLLAGCGRPAPEPEQAPDASGKSSPVVVRNKAEQRAPVSPILVAARSQIGKTVTYDPSYVGLSYPGGDVPIEKGVCTDVVVRALRDALKMDLQKLVHEDMKAAFSKYPNKWGLKKPDRNIDHRRVPNLRRYFERKGYSVGVSQKKEDYLPGDIVSCIVGGKLAHIMIVSDRKADNGVPLVVHNIGNGAKEEDCLFGFPTTGHYRIEARSKKTDGKRP